VAQLGTNKLKIKVGATEHTASCSRVEITAGEADSDFTSFTDAAAGGAVEWALEATCAQDLATGSVWRYLWDNPGTTVAVKVAPYGNATASATEPHYSGNVTVKVPDGTVIGGEANASTSARMTFDIRWVFTAKPTEATSGTF
jgi:hypothetical protein